jgi:hypothetical protein
MSSLTRSVLLWSRSDAALQALREVTMLVCIVLFTWFGQCNVLNNLDMALEIRHWQLELQRLKASAAQRIKSSTRCRPDEAC